MKKRGMVRGRRSRRAQGQRLAVSSIPKSAWKDLEFLRMLWTWMTDEQPDEAWPVEALKEGILGLGKTSQDKLVPWLWRAWKVAPETKTIRVASSKGKNVEKTRKHGGKTYRYKSWVPQSYTKRTVTRRQQFNEAQMLIRDWWASVSHERKAKDLPPEFDSVAGWAKDQHGMFEGPKTGLPLDQRFKDNIDKAFHVVATWKDGFSWRMVKQPIKGGKYGRWPVETLMEIGHVQAHCYLSEGVSEHYTSTGSEMCVLFDKNLDPRCTFEIKVRKDEAGEYTWQMGEMRGIYNIFPVQKYWPYIAGLMGVEPRDFRNFPSGIGKLPPNAGTGEPPRARDPRPDGINPLYVEAWAAGHYRKALIDSVQGTLDSIVPKAKEAAKERDERMARWTSSSGSYRGGSYDGGGSGYEGAGWGGWDDDYWTNWGHGVPTSSTRAQATTDPIRQLPPPADTHEGPADPEPEWIVTRTDKSDQSKNDIVTAEVVWQGAYADDSFEELSSFVQIEVFDKMPKTWDPVGVRKTHEDTRYGEITFWISPFFSEIWDDEPFLMDSLYWEALHDLRIAFPEVHLLRLQLHTEDEARQASSSFLQRRGFNATNKLDNYKYLKPAAQKEL